MIKPELEQSIVSIDDVISLDDNEDPASADEMEDSASVSGVSAGIYQVLFPAYYKTCSNCRPGGIFTKKKMIDPSKLPTRWGFV